MEGGKERLHLFHIVEGTAQGWREALSGLSFSTAAHWASNTHTWRSCHMRQVVRYKYHCMHEAADSSCMPLLCALK